jgi:hypothetical protein
MLIIMDYKEIKASSHPSERSKETRQTDFLSGPARPLPNIPPPAASPHTQSDFEKAIPFTFKSFPSTPSLNDSYLLIRSWLKCHPFKKMFSWLLILI